MATNENFIPAVYHTGIVQGDDFEEKFTFIQDDKFINVVNANTCIQIVSPLNVVTGVYKLNTGLEFTSNTLVWSIPASNTANFIPDTYTYSLKMVLDNKIKTYVYGNFNVISTMHS